MKQRKKEKRQKSEEDRVSREEDNELMRKLFKIYALHYHYSRERTEKFTKIHQSLLSRQEGNTSNYR